MEEQVRNVAEEGLIRLHRISILLERGETEAAKGDAAQGIRRLEDVLERVGGDPAWIATEVFKDV